MQQTPGEEDPVGDVFDTLGDAAESFLGPARNADQPRPTLGGDIACVQCGYNLRGLAEQGNCPECGAAVALSLRDDRLIFANPAWVAQLATAMNWLLVGLLIGFPLTCLGGGFALPHTSSHWIAAVPLFPMGVGVWLLTCGDPRQPDEKLRWRMMARWGLIAWAGLILLKSATNGDFDLRIGQMVMTQVAGVVFLYGFWSYLAHLAVRLAERKLPQQCRAVMWGMFICLGTYWAGIMAIIVSSMGGTGPTGARSVGMMVSGYLSCMGVLGLLVFAVWQLVLLLWLRSRFASAAQLTQRHWATTSELV